MKIFTNTSPYEIWFIIGVALSVLELFVPGCVLILFGIGAFVTALLAWLFSMTDWSLMLPLFYVFSAIAFLFFQSRFRGMFFGRTNSKSSNWISDPFVGEKALVVREIEPVRGGRVEYHGVEWQAVADENIPIGAVVEIVGKDNLTLTVKFLTDGKGE